MVWRSINQYVRDYVSKDYAGHDPVGKIRLDCSLGVNSDPLEDVVFERLHDFRQKGVCYEDFRGETTLKGGLEELAGAAFSEGNYEEIKYYPHDDSIRETLAKWYISRGAGESRLTADNFLLGNGSYDILVGINMMCLTRGRKVLGHAPQFTAYVDSVYCTGSDYLAAELPESDNYRFDPDGYLKMMTDDVDLFIIENPNNPTGQKIPVGDISRIAEKALHMQKLLVVDEAYAEYLPFEDSAVNLIHDYPNIIVTRSFSKGWGMAGLRLGYAVASTETDLLTQLSKITLPFNSNALARTLAKSSLESDMANPGDIFGVSRVAEQKRRLIESIGSFNSKYGKSLKVAVTHAATPIMMVYCDTAGTELDLYRHMLSKGLLSVSCESYVGLDSRAVRLMLPEEEYTDLLIEIMEEVIRDLP